MKDAAAARPAATARPEIADEDALVTVREVDAWYGVRHVLHGVELVIRPRECLAWWVSPARERRRSRGASRACTLPYSGAISTEGNRSSEALGRATRTRDVRSSTCSRALTTRSTRGRPSADRQSAAAPLLLARRFGGTATRHRGPRHRATLVDGARPLPASALGRRAPAAAIARALIANPSCWSATRSHPRSTCRCRPRSSTCWPTSSGSSTSGCSSSRTTWRSSAPCRRRWRS